MIIVGNMQLFHDHLTEGTTPGVSLSWGEQIWYLYSRFISFRRGNIILIYLGRTEVGLHGPMHKSGHLEYR